MAQPAGSSVQLSDDQRSKQSMSQSSDANSHASDDAETQAAAFIATQLPAAVAADITAGATDPVQEHQADLMRAIMNSKQDLQQSIENDATASAAASVAASGVCSEVSVVSAIGDERCFLPGTMLPDMEGKLVCVENLRQHDCVRAADGQSVRVARVKHHLTTSIFHQIILQREATVQPFMKICFEQIRFCHVEPRPARAPKWLLSNKNLIENR